MNMRHPRTGLTSYDPPPEAKVLLARNLSPKNQNKNGAGIPIPIAMNPNSELPHPYPSVLY
jgi:hypothetical protein